MERAVGEVLARRAAEVRVAPTPEARLAVERRVRKRAQDRRRRRGVVGIAAAAIGVGVVVNAGAWPLGDSVEDTVTTGTLEGSRCDTAFNTATFNETTVMVDELDSRTHPVGDAVDFTVEEWAEVFTDERLGGTVQATAAEFENDTARREAVVSGALTPTLEPDPWVPLIEPTQCAALAAELRQARAAAARYPTLGDAQADGYLLASTDLPGHGAHFRKDELLDETFDPAEPEMLLFDGTDETASLAGIAYWVGPEGGRPPDGFTGDNDGWNRQEQLCLGADGVAVGPSSLTTEECADRGGTQTDNLVGWMAHVWLVPGCESDWGLFSWANPALPFLPEGAPFARGCNSGRSVTDPLAFDDPGDGPHLSP